VPVALSAIVADFASPTQLHIREDARVDWSENVYDPNVLGTGPGLYHCSVILGLLSL
jgi:hypothetical protein